MRSLFLAAALVLVACGAEVAPPDADREPCTSQLDCSTEFTQVCESGYCSGTLYKREDLSDLRLGLATGVKLQGPKSMRVFVLYQVTPSGKTVKCSEITGVGDLSDPAKYNQTAYPIEMPIIRADDVISSGVFVNGEGRVIYTEIYDAPLSDSPKRIGVGCLENAPMNGMVVIDVKAVAG